MKRVEDNWKKKRVKLHVLLSQMQLPCLKIEIRLDLWVYKEKVGFCGKVGRDKSRHGLMAYMLDTDYTP
jgi:hypothetical protein